MLVFTILVVGSMTNAQALWTQQSTSSLAFEGVTVIDVRDGRLLPEQSVVVTGNRIQSQREWRLRWSSSRFGVDGVSAIELTARHQMLLLTKTQNF